VSAECRQAGLEFRALPVGVEAIRAEVKVAVMADFVAACQDRGNGVRMVAAAKLAGLARQ
jgi:hypothetical protein